MLNKINKATIITSISLTTGLVFWAGVLGNYGIQIAFGVFTYTPLFSYKLHIL